MGIRILYIDDEDDNRSLAKDKTDRMENKTYELVIPDDPMKVMEEIPTADIVVTDWQLEDWSHGLDASPYIAEALEAGKLVVVRTLTDEPKRNALRKSLQELFPESGNHLHIVDLWENDSKFKEFPGLELDLYASLPKDEKIKLV